MNNEYDNGYVDGNNNKRKESEDEDYLEGYEHGSTEHPYDEPQQ